MAISTPIDKERNKKKYNRIYLIVGLVAYVIVALTILHYSVVKADNPRLEAGEAINIALLHIITKPLEIFHTRGNIALMLFLGSIAGAMLLLMVMSERALKKHDNPDTVNGEAHMMNAEELEKYNLKFSAPLGKPENDGPNNMIISKDIRLAIDNRGTRRNCNILVIGGSGAGKSRFFASPNILQYNCNFVITDPSGELLHDYGKALEDNGYAVKVFNLTDVYRSNRYNPFHYINEEKDVFTLVNTLIKNTTPPDGHGGDPFWENSEKLLLTALILFLRHVAPRKEDMTFEKVLRLLDLAEVDENDPQAVSDLDKLFNSVREKDPENLAVRQYDKFKIGAGKTLKSILISVGVRLQSFDLSDIKYLTGEDDFEFESFADTKQALFVIIPTADTTFNFLVSLLYSQLFASLYTYAETRAEFGWKLCIDDLTNIKVEQAESRAKSEEAKKKLIKLKNEILKAGTVVECDKEKKLYKVYSAKTHTLLGWRGTKKLKDEFIESLKHVKVEPCGMRCPNHVRLILDEFANIGQIPDFDQKLATMRKYEISCSIILQALSQLKDIYKDKWNTIVGNCDTKLFLGSDDGETIEWMIKMLGKRTTTVENMSFQSQGNGSTSYNKSSIELMTVDQVSMMQDDECLVRIRGVRPYYGKKFELTLHPNYDYAHKTSGTFVIPLSSEAKPTDHTWLRDRDDDPPADPNNAQEQAQTPVNAKEQTMQMFGSTQKTEQSQESDTKSDSPVQKNEDKPKNVLNSEYDINSPANRAKREKAAEAKEFLKSFEDKFTPDAEDMLALSFLESVGVKPGASDTEIKESVESVVELMTVPSEPIIFNSTKS